MNEPDKHCVGPDRLTRVGAEEIGVVAPTGRALRKLTGGWAAVVSRGPEVVQVVLVVDRAVVTDLGRDRGRRGVLQVSPSTSSYWNHAWRDVVLGDDAALSACGWLQSRSPPMSAPHVPRLAQSRSPTFLSGLGAPNVGNREPARSR
jgi:hypothetical protein